MKKGFHRRRGGRAHVAIPVRFKPAKGLTPFYIEGFITNISREGIYMVTPSIFPVGTPLRLKLSIPERSRSLSFSAVVVNRTSRSEEQEGGIGLSLTDMAQADRTVFEDFVESLYRYGWYV